MSCAFVAGLPDRVKQVLRAGVRIESLDLNQIVEKARMLLIEEPNSDAAFFARGTSKGNDRGRESITVRGNSQHKPIIRTCFKCGLPNHFARESPTNVQSDPGRVSATSSEARVCYRCNKPGHIARDCNLNSQEEKPSTPVFSSKN